MHYGYLLSSERCMTISSKLFLKYVVFTNLTLIRVSYSVNKHRVVTAVLEVVRLEMLTESVPKKWCIKFRYTRR
jgi:hypothetical protein